MDESFTDYYFKTITKNKCSHVPKCTMYNYCNMFRAKKRINELVGINQRPRCCDTSKPTQFFKNHNQSEKYKKSSLVKKKSTVY